MKRWLLKILPALSMLLCVFVMLAVVGAWSLFRFMPWDNTLPPRWSDQRILTAGLPGQTSFVIGTDHDHIVLFHFPDPAEWPPTHSWFDGGSFGGEEAAFTEVSSVAGLSYGTVTAGGNVVEHRFAAPMWMIWLAAAIYPACQIVAWFHRHKNRDPKAVLCLKCGYDLRASKERCPECGTPITTNTEAKT